MPNPAPGFVTRPDYRVDLLPESRRVKVVFADVTIATNESYKQIQIERANKNPRNVFVVRNGPNQMRMTPAAPSARFSSWSSTAIPIGWSAAICWGPTRPRLCRGWR